MRKIGLLSAASLTVLVGVAALLATPARSDSPALSYIPGSTVKINQILGEKDKETNKPTLSRTYSRYGLRGVDLGYSFENQGRAFFLFGDTVGVAGHALDSIATTGDGPDATSPDRGVRLNFLSDKPHTYLTVQPPGIDMGAFNVPVSGITLGKQMYVVVKSGHSEAGPPADYSILTKVASPITAAGFQPIGSPVSKLPGGHFIKMSMHVQPGEIAGLPPGGPFVLIWGTGWYRHSDAYLAIRPVAQFENATSTRYFHGLDAAGVPLWSKAESDAEPIVKNGTIGDLSVTWCRDCGAWLMTYDSRPPAATGILFAFSSTPWGPWSSPQVIFNAVTDGAMGKFIHDPSRKPSDGLAGPVIGKGTAHAESVRGGAYAPYVVERWTKVQGSELDIYYVLSTWNPYVVDLMKSRFHIGTLNR